MVILKYQLTEEEFFEFNYFTSWGAPDKRGYRIRYVLRTIIWYVVVAAVYIFAIRKDFSAMAFIIFAVPAIIYFLLIPMLVKRGIRQRVRTMLAKPENKQFLEPSELVITDTGIIAKDSVSETKYNWEGIVRKAETSSCYFLYTNTQFAIVIPKRILNNPRERQELQQLFNQHLSLSSEFPDR
jgi:hypothetical protein